MLESQIKQFYEMLESQVILKLWGVKLRETIALKAKAVTCIGFDVKINSYSLWYANSFLLSRP